jgi:hypothetical protein
MTSILNQNTLNTVLKRAQCMFFTQGHSIYIMILFTKIGPISRYVLEGRTRENGEGQSVVRLEN